MSVSFVSHFLRRCRRSPREQLSAPFELTVRFASRDADLGAEAILDREATLTTWQDGEVLRRIHGVVSEFGCGDSGHRRTFYHVVICPALWRLGLRQNSRIFQQVSPLTVLNTLCDEHGLSDVAFAATREPESREYLTQYRETDLAFVQRLAAEEGLFYFHEFDDGHRPVFADAPQVLSHLGERSYHGRAGGTPPQRHVRRLQQVARVAPASATLKDYSFKNPAYAQLHDHMADGLEAHAKRADYEHYDYPGRYKADASGEAFTRIRLEALRQNASTADAEHDRQTARYPRYWRDLDLQAWKAGEGAAQLKAQIDYPWARQRCQLTPQLGKVEMATYRERQQAAVA